WDPVSAAEDLLTRSRSSQYQGILGEPIVPGPPTTHNVPWEKGQSQEDIRKKLQKLEGKELRSLDKLLEVAWKVYNNRDKEVAKKQGQNLLAVIQGQGRGDRTGQGGNRDGFGRGCGGLAINQCALCRMMGHWNRECPNRFNQTSEPQIENAAAIMVLYGGEPGSKERMVTLCLEGKNVSFLVDTGATHSVGEIDCNYRSHREGGDTAIPATLRSELWRQNSKT
ncbi:hypothetical protein HGM15179_020061, partial [Zosterops borbonicus]